MTARRLLVAAALVAVVVYCIDNVRELIRQIDRQPEVADTIERIRATGPGWQR